MSISSFCACFPVGYRIRNAWRRSRKQSRHVACLIHYLSFCCVTFHAFENLRSSYVCDLWSGRASYFLSLSCSLVVVLFFLHLFASLVFCVGSRSCTLDSWKRGRNSSLRSAPCRLIIMLTSRFEGIIPLLVTSGLSSHMGCFILWWFPLFSPYRKLSWKIVISCKTPRRFGQALCFHPLGDVACFVQVQYFGWKPI